MKTMLGLAASALLSLTPTAPAEAGERYAIRNVQTGMNLRPQGAKRHDGNAVVLYDAWTWKCMTWEFSPAGQGAYALRNVYTSKTMAAASPAAGAGIEQRAMTAGTARSWEFLPTPAGSYLVKVQGSELYVTAVSDRTNSRVELLPLRDTDDQRWRLVPQDPWF